jgi:L-2-hydroxycarboxylate dehydrogenase (NAD+)
MLVLDIARFVPLAQFKAHMGRHLQDLRASPRLPGFDAIRLPGEQRQSRRAERARDGVPLVGEVIAQLDKLADELNVKRLPERI